MNRSDVLLVQNVTDEQITTYVRGFIIYGIEGCLLAISNFLITLVVFVYSDLRQQKEYVIVAGLAFANGLQGFAFIVAGIGRILMIKAGYGFVLVSRWQCSIAVWNLIWLFASPWQDTTLLMVSIDRFIAVAFPLRYFSFSTRYAYLLNFFAYVGALPQIIASVVISYSYQKPEFPAICYTQAGLSDGYFRFKLMLRFCITVISLALYVPILILLQKALKTGQSISERQVATQISRLKKVTITLAISAFFVLLFSTVPDIVEMLNILTDKLPLYIIVNGNEIAYIFIYSLRFKDIRQGLISLFLLRPLKKNNAAFAPRQTITRSQRA
uniref:G-protein coupled receptors family 1 profile domain-containing protein n=1 Tax=Plectus sambesii TaxID=2011161 RepID=A0A914WI51_9BILA